jgi:parallel beta-helix repeat protein
MSTSDSIITGNDFENNAHHGVSLEVSATSIVADNQFIGNTDDGLLINDTQSVQVWNNTFVRNALAIEIVQDQRHASDPEDAHNLDPRRPKPDPRMTWYVGPVTVSNNVIALPRSGDDWLLCVKDATHKRSAAQMGVKSNGDVYNRISSYAIAVVWSKGAGDPAVFRSISAFKSATGQEANSVAVDGKAIVSTTGVLDPSVASQAGSIARPLPSTVASHTGRAAGTRALGTFTSR